MPPILDPLTLDPLASAPPEPLPIRRALLSVSDKTGLVALARALHEGGVELVSTGGTARALEEAGLPVTPVEAVTGHPEIMDGRVKTLHPAIHGGLLGLPDLHAHEMRTHAIAPFELVVANLYPFAAALAAGSDAATLVENIDIGGPAMLRAAAKNHLWLTVLSDPAQYAGFLEHFAADGAVPRAERFRLAAAAFAATARYDAAVAGWMHETGDAGEHPGVFAAPLAATLRYGENPHQSATLHRDGTGAPGPATAEQVQGKALSHNNLLDADAAWACVCEFERPAARARPAVAIVKHANPCGVGLGETLAEAHARALACDPVSAFGGIVAVNRPLDEAAAQAIAAVFTEVVVAPAADDGARGVLAARPGLRLLLTGGTADPRAQGRSVRSVAGGLLVQSLDNAVSGDLTVVTRRAPTAEEEADLRFAFAVAKHVRSNAIVFARAGATVGIGAGQMSRVDAARIARWKGEEQGLLDGRSGGFVVASDAFFPFADALELALEAGATAVIQPGGSKRDAEVIAAANAAGAAMVLTGLRHFRH